MSQKKGRFKWTRVRSEIAVYLAAGHTVAEASKEHGVGERSIWRWKADSNFAAEVDRLTLMVDIAGRAERLRLAMRVVRQKLKNAEDEHREMSKADLLYWMQYIQSETDGAKIDVSGLLAAVAAVAPPLAREGSSRGDAVGADDDNETE